MRRIAGRFIYGAVVLAIAFGLLFSLGSLAPAGSRAITVGFAAASAGVVLGLVVAWLRGHPWNRALNAVHRFAGRLGVDRYWIAVGLAATAVLLFY